MITKKNASMGLVLAAVVGLLSVAPVFAASSSPTNTPYGYGYGARQGGPMHGFYGNRGNMPMMKPAVVGTVSAVDGPIITVNGRQGFGMNSSSTTAFAVDATNAQVVKNNTTSTYSNIAVGDNVFVQGTVTGTNVVATMIRDGQMRGRMVNPPLNGNNPPKRIATSTNIITGNGQPVVAGTVSAISGSTLTISNKSNVTYTVDVSNAKIVNGPNTITVSDINIGDSVIVQGVVNGSSITASSVIDQTRPNAATATSTNTKTQHPGLFGAIGQFFAHIFGF